MTLLISYSYSVFLSVHLSRLIVLVNLSVEFDFFPLLFRFYFDLVDGSIVLVLFFLVGKSVYFFNIFICGVNASYEFTEDITERGTLWELLFISIWIKIYRLRVISLEEKIGLFRIVFLVVQRNMVIEKVVYLYSFHFSLFC